MGRLYLTVYAHHYWLESRVGQDEPSGLPLDKTVLNIVAAFDLESKLRRLKLANKELEVLTAKKDSISSELTAENFSFRKGHHWDLY